MIRSIFIPGRKFCPQLCRYYAMKPKPIRIQYNNVEERDNVFINSMLNIKGNTAQEWKVLREELLSTSKQVTPYNIDSVILNYCIKNEHYNEAKAYLDLVEKENIKLSLAAVGKYFKLYHVMYVGKLSTEDDEEKIISMYKSLCKEYPILDSITCENVILGLSVTKQWKECIKLLNDIKISAIPNVLAYNAVASAAFSHNEYDIGWNILKEMTEKNRYPHTTTYLTYLDQIQECDDKTKLTKLEELLKFTAYYDLTFDEKVSDKIYKATNRRARATTITSNGTCKKCNNKLQLLKLTASEFEKLKTAFFKDIIIGRDVFTKSTPEELETFKRFVNNMGEMDVIIDGLNVAYAAGTKHSPMVISMFLAAVVRHFVKLNKRILVLGRKHLNKLPRQNMDFVRRNATLFLTDNLSQDDPYLLYCGLHSGLNTIIVSKDLMRSHLFLLKDKDNKLLFNRWLIQSRYHLLHATPNEVTFQTPLPYMIMPQKGEDHWHIPYVLSTSESTKSPMYRWLCVPP